MIINLTGPPCAGKSTFASRFVLEHPEFRYCAIDAYRVELEDEGLAWTELLIDILGQRNIVLESCGLNYRLQQIFNNETIRRRPTTSVEFTAPRELLINRLMNRQHKRPLPEPFRPEDELIAIDYVLEHLGDQIIPPDIKVSTSWPFESWYQEVVNKINAARIDSVSHRTRRSETFFTKGVPNKRAEL